MTIKEINYLLGSGYKTKLEFKSKVDWVCISIYYKLPEEFIREFKNEVIWLYICIKQKLSEEFIREFKNEVCWICISQYQKLSEEFIREFQDRVKWYYIFKYQKLTEEFIREFINILALQTISSYQKLSNEFIREFNLRINEDNWLYKDIEFKKQSLIKTGLYECHEDYFIGYKIIREDRYSFLDFQQHYLPNEIYESHCDCTDEENSFGLSVCTNEEIKKLKTKGLITKIKAYYKDIGRITDKNRKVRCFKITFLN